MTPYYQDDHVTLYRGDCLELDAWLAADVLVTDPPYGMAYVSGHRNDDCVAIAGDATSGHRDDALAAWGERPALVFGTWRVPRPTDTRLVLHWWKTTLGAGMGDLTLPWGTATEEIYVLGKGFAGKRRANVYPTSDQRRGTVGAAALIGHPTPKPVGLMEDLVSYCPPGVIADPFAGSGSTLIAARNLGRQAIGVELEERYCEIIARRLSADVLDFEVTA